MEEIEDAAVELFVTEEGAGGLVAPRAAKRYRTLDRGALLSNNGDMTMPFEWLQQIGANFDAKGTMYVSMWREMEDGAMVVRFSRYEPWLGEKRKVEIRQTSVRITVIQAYPSQRQRIEGVVMMSEIMFPWYFKNRKSGHVFRYKPYLRILSEPWEPGIGEKGAPVDKVLEMQFTGLELSRLEKARLEREAKKALGAP